MPIENGVLIASIKLRGDTLAELNALDPVLLDREVAVETDTYTVVAGKRVYKCKIGPGQWSVLPYAALGDAGMTEADVDTLIAAHAAAPDPHGDRAYTDAQLAGMDLGAVLVNGSATNGRSITVTENDGVNWEQGANMVRVKAPASVASARTITWPDKSGTVATTDDVAAVAALIDGTMRAPEAYTPSGGLYPTTYGGNAVEKGDTFRCAAGTMGGTTVNAEDLLIALVDAPGQTDGNWQVLESNRVVATQSEAEDNTSTDLNKLMPVQRWWQAWTKGLTLSAFFEAVRGTVLTGLVKGSGAVADTDTILQAVGKLNATRANRLVTVVTKSASYTLANGNDTGPDLLLRMNLASSGTLTLPPNSSVPLPIGSVVVLSQAGAGQITVTAGSGVTINSRGGATKTAAQYSVASAVKVDTDTWLLTGDITA